MFPWVYGFHWSPGYLIFLGVFFTVALAVAATIILALWRSFRDVRQGRVPQLEWAQTFHDLTPQERACRHALTGDIEGRVCQNNFDCRCCQKHATLAEESTALCTHDIFGMSVPLDRYYHRGHTWAQPQPDGTFLIGLDEMARRLAGANSTLDLPAPGTKLHANSPAFTLRREGHEVRILSPLDGDVVDAPGDGYLVRLKPAGEPDTRHLLRGREVRAWYLRELERLQLAMGGAATLADGGILVDDVSAATPARQWDALCGVIFLDA
jgi:hypothetical protein